MAQLTCLVVTPEETALEAQADFIAVPLYDGELGIAPGHSPLIGRLGFGELRLRAAGATRRYFIDGGFVQVADNVVSILTSRAVPASAVNVPAAEAQLAESLRMPTHTDEAIAARDRAMSRARAQLHVASKA